MAVIKPDAVVHGKTDEIIMKVRETTLTLQTILMSSLLEKQGWSIV